MVKINLTTSTGYKNLNVKYANSTVVSLNSKDIVQEIADIVELETPTAQGNVDQASPPTLTNAVFCTTDPNSDCERYVGRQRLKKAAHQRLLKRPLRA